MTREAFEQRERYRLGLFSDTWTKAVPKVFEDVPHYYRPGNILASLGLWELWVWQFIRTIQLHPGDKVLDLCAGTNFVGIKLLKKEPRISVTALDRSREMQEKGRQDAEKLGFHIDSIIHDTRDPFPFADNTFDVITLQAASRHLQMDRVLPEIYRVLKPGGRFYHCDMLKPANPALEWLYLTYLSVALPFTAMIFGSSQASRDCGGYFVEAIRNFYTPEELSSVLSLLGFTDVTCKKSIWGGMVGFHAAQKPL
jgi:demethylmenaquinone methyltransferase/2-methoxy-6-polyprenyl-1,4-benzoquinol methylase